MDDQENYHLELKPNQPKWRRQLKLGRGKKYFFACLIVIIAAGLGLWGWMTWHPVNFAAKPVGYVAPPKPAPVYYSPLSGRKVDSLALTKRPVTAVMIENSPWARPQSGLKQADVVFEAIAEGGITRFMALYQESQPSLLGPVRSLRPYYAEWGYAFDDSMAHVGGSNAAKRMIRSGKYGVDLEQMFNGSYYWRSKDRYAPHNVYTNFKKLNALNKKKGHTTSKFDGFERKDDQPSKSPSAKTINIDISSDLYNVKYVYDAKDDSYWRYMAGKKHMDREKGQIKPKVVIVIKVSEYTIPGGTHGRQDIQTTGSGTCYVFQDGTAQKCTWKKASAKSQLHFLDKNGKDIALNRGQTWITAQPTGHSLKWQ
ncbi:MAG TPA: DUF3048 domain-containing protein [Candidatus Saccharimonadales bacterium]|nr:DUF3048 domain-containing protein [Candidatus Saccharimonadales bacterium]